MVIELEHEGDGWNILPNNSTVLNLIVLQGLAMALVEHFGVPVDVLHANHPGGAIGAQLDAAQLEAELESPALGAAKLQERMFQSPPGDARTRPLPARTHLAPRPRRHSGQAQRPRDRRPGHAAARGRRAPRADPSRGSGGDHHQPHRGAPRVDARGSWPTTESATTTSSSTHRSESGSSSTTRSLPVWSPPLRSTGCGSGRRPSGARGPNDLSPGSRGRSSMPMFLPARSTIWPP